MITTMQANPQPWGACRGRRRRRTLYRTLAGPGREARFGASVLPALGLSQTSLPLSGCMTSAAAVL